MSAVIALAFIAFNVQYQNSYRQLDNVEATVRYDTHRIDYGRDHGIKLALFAELNPDQLQILQYRGQSFLFGLTFLVPREWWPNKPWPYTVYSTAASMRSAAKYAGWGVTTSILEEAVANLGWLGLLAGPLFVAYLCRFGDSTGSILVMPLTLTVTALFLAVQLPAFISLFLIWLGLVICLRISMRQELRRHARRARLAVLECHS